MPTIEGIDVGTIARSSDVKLNRDGTLFRKGGLSLSRRGLQIALGVLWIVDGLLQLQPFMFTHNFAEQVIAPSASGQPGWVAWPVLHSAHLIGAHPVEINVVFALTQLALGAGFFLPRTVRLAVVASIGWAAGVWFLGEGLGGLAGGTATLLGGAPGAALLYAVLALAASPKQATSTPDQAIPSWFARVWSALWFGQALLALLPATRSDGSVVGQIRMAGDSAPGWLRPLDGVVAQMAHGLGGGTFALLVIVPTGIGLAGLGKRTMRELSAFAGITVALATWAVGQNFGSLASGMATDPSTGPLLVLGALALLGVGETVRHRVDPAE